ncbi:unnamed protein product, partial [Lampetra planeri]
RQEQALNKLQMLGDNRLANHLADLWKRSDSATFAEDFAIPGKSTLRCVEDAINNSAFTLLLLTKNFNTRMLELETDSALINSINKQHKNNSVIPILPLENSMPRGCMPIVLQTLQKRKRKKKMKMGDAAEDRRTFIVPAIKSLDHYDFSRGKISCSLTWLVVKAFGSDAVPEELAEPFYRDQYNQEHLKPPVACLLQSAELYCRAGSLILRSDAVKPLLGHNAVIQALAQKGLYVTDEDRLVSERDLASTAHKHAVLQLQRRIHTQEGTDVFGLFVEMCLCVGSKHRWSSSLELCVDIEALSCHLALIDTLMMAYTLEMVSVDRVMSCIHRFSSHSDGHVQELPYDTEDAITTWINKVNEHLWDVLVEEQKVRDSSLQESTSSHKSPSKWYLRLVPARYRKELAQQRSAPSLPLVDDLLKDNTDGCALTALLHFYCPRAVRLEDICLKETMSLADSLYNLQLVQDFCRNNLNRCCHFSLEDMLYAHASIK